EGVRGAQVSRQGLRRTRTRAAGALQAETRALQIPALDRVPRRPAEDRDRKDPALPPPRRERHQANLSPKKPHPEEGAKRPSRRMPASCVWPPFETRFARTSG